LIRSPSVEIPYAPIATCFAQVLHSKTFIETGVFTQKYFCFDLLYSEVWN